MDASPPPPPRPPTHFDQVRALRIVSIMSLVGGAFLLVSLFVPHANTTYDDEFAFAGIGLLLVGLILRWRGKRDHASRFEVHLANGIFSGFILLLTWLGMVDVGGIHVALLFIPLVLATSVGPRSAALTLLALQSAGYAAVLATSDPILGFDRFTQWLVVTLSLIVGFIYQDMMRRQLIDVLRKDIFAREAHAQRLELVNQELEHTNELKENFVAMASHELRTPLTSIAGFATTLTDKWDAIPDADKREYISIIEEQSVRLGRLVGDLLTLSRIENRRLDMQTTHVRLTEAVEHAARSIGIEVAIEGDCDLVPAIGPDHCEQVLVNLLANASIHGAPPFTITCLNDGAWCRIAIEDRGPGVPEEFVPQLFTRFSRASNDEGTGLGLSIVEGLVTTYGGSLAYEHAEPHGARFVLTLPAPATD